MDQGWTCHPISTTIIIIIIIVIITQEVLHLIRFSLHHRSTWNKAGRGRGLCFYTQLLNRF